MHVSNISPHVTARCTSPQQSQWLLEEILLQLFGCFGNITNCTIGEGGTDATIDYATADSAAGALSLDGKTRWRPRTHACTR